MDLKIGLMGDSWIFVGGGGQAAAGEIMDQTVSLTHGEKTPRL